MTGAGGEYVQNVPVVMVARRWLPRAGCTRSIRVITSRIRAVTVLRARSPWSPRRRGRPAQARGGGQLVQEGVAFGAGPGGAFRVGPVLGLGDLLGEVVEAGPDLLPGGRVQDLVRAEAKAGQGLAVGVGGSDEVGRGDRLAGAAEQDGEVAEALGVAHPHGRAGVGERPQAAVPGEPARRGGRRPGRVRGCVGRRGQAVQTESPGRGGGFAQQLQRRGPPARTRAGVA